MIPLPKPGEPRPPYNIFDPCIWKSGGMYYALTAGSLHDGPGGKPVRAEFLHRSKDLATWEYLHPFLEGDRYGIVGDDGACPYFWPIGDRHILLHYSHTSGGKYLLGDYDTKCDKFVVTYGSDFNFGRQRARRRARSLRLPRQGRQRHRHLQHEPGESDPRLEPDHDPAAAFDAHRQGPFWESSPRAISNRCAACPPTSMP